ncbi:MAG: DUF5119 domain-containing protein [Bacteroides sp.]|nr:DUF5119 domain-containing protein [Bacteroides sp.]
MLSNINNCYRLHLPGSSYYLSILNLIRDTRRHAAPCHRAPVILFAALMMTALAMTSCRHKEIACPGGEAGVITVKFIWDNAPEAAPDGMTLYFFSLEDGGRVWRYDIAGRDGGSVELPSGSYRLLAYNNDLPRISFSDINSYNTFTANAAFSGSGTVYPPGTLYVGTVEALTVTPCGVEYVTPDGDIKQCNQGLIRCYPRRLTVNYTIKVRGMKGLKHLRSASAKLSGLAPSLGLVDDLPSGNAVSQIATLTPSTPDSLLTGQMSGFGTAPDSSGNFLTVTIVRSDGKNYVKTFDVTGQVVNSMNVKDVLIVVEGFEIPDDVGPSKPDTDVGIEVDIDGWDVINIDLSTQSPQTAS